MLSRTNYPIYLEHHSSRYNLYFRFQQGKSLPRARTDGGYLFNNNHQPRTMITVAEPTKDDNVYCRFTQFTVVNSCKLNVW